MKKYSWIIPVLTAVSVCFSGCVSSDSTGNAETAAENGYTAEELEAYFLRKADEVEVTETTVIFTDDSGGGICELEKNPGNVVSLYASLTTLWYEAGGTVTGCIGSKSTVELYREFIGRDITLDDGMTVVSTSAAAKNWDTEVIIALSPSLILCSTAMNGYETIKGPADAAGIPVIAVDYDDFSDYLKWFKVFCNLNGKPELWDAVVSDVLGNVVETVLGVPDGESPKALAVFADTTGLSADTSGTVVGGMITMLGGTNIADPYNTSGAERITIGLESVYASDPDVILVQCHTDTETARELIENTYGDNAVWQSLDAVKEGRVYYLEKSLFHSKPGSRFADAYRILAELLYGDLQADD